MSATLWQLFLLFALCGITFSQDDGTSDVEREYQNPSIRLQLNATQKEIEEQLSEWGKIRLETIKFNCLTIKDSHAHNNFFYSTVKDINEQCGTDLSEESFEIYKNTVICNKDKYFIGYHHKTIQETLTGILDEIVDIRQSNSTVEEGDIPERVEGYNNEFESLKPTMKSVLDRFDSDGAMDMKNSRCNSCLTRKDRKERTNWNKILRCVGSSNIWTNKSTSPEKVERKDENECIRFQLDAIEYKIQLQLSKWSEIRPEKIEPNCHTVNKSQINDVYTNFSNANVKDVNEKCGTDLSEELFKTYKDTVNCNWEKYNIGNQSETIQKELAEILDEINSVRRRNSTVEERDIPGLVKGYNSEFERLNATMKSEVLDYLDLNGAIKMKDSHCNSCLAKGDEGNLTTWNRTLQCIGSPYNWTDNSTRQEKKQEREYENEDIRRQLNAIKNKTQLQLSEWSGIGLEKIDFNCWIIENSQIFYVYSNFYYGTVKDMNEQCGTDLSEELFKTYKDIVNCNWEKYYIRNQTETILKELAEILDKINSVLQRNSTVEERDLPGLVKGYNSEFERLNATMKSKVLDYLDLNGAIKMKDSHCNSCLAKGDEGNLTTWNRTLQCIGSPYNWTDNSTRQEKKQEREYENEDVRRQLNAIKNKTQLQLSEWSGIGLEKIDFNCWIINNSQIFYVYSNFYYGTVKDMNEQCGTDLSEELFKTYKDIVNCNWEKYYIRNQTETILKELAEILDKINSVLQRNSTVEERDLPRLVKGYNSEFERLNATMKSEVLDYLDLNGAIKMKNSICNSCLAKGDEGNLTTWNRTLRCVGSSYIWTDNNTRQGKYAPEYENEYIRRQLNAAIVKIQLQLSEWSKIRPEKINFNCWTIENPQIYNVYTNFYYGTVKDINEQCGTDLSEEWFEIYNNTVRCNYEKYLIGYNYETILRKVAEILDQIVSISQGNWKVEQRYIPGLVLKYESEFETLYDMMMKEVLYYLDLNGAIKMKDSRCNSCLAKGDEGHLTTWNTTLRCLGSSYIWPDKSTHQEKKIGDNLQSIPTEILRLEQTLSEIENEGVSSVYNVAISEMNRYVNESEDMKKDVDAYNYIQRDPLMASTNCLESDLINIADYYTRQTTQCLEYGIRESQLKFDCFKKSLDTYRLNLSEKKALVEECERQVEPQRSNCIANIEASLLQIESDAATALRVFDSSMKELDSVYVNLCPHWLTEGSPKESAGEYITNRLKLKTCTLFSPERDLSEETGRAKYEYYSSRLNNLKNLLALNYEGQIYPWVKESMDKSVNEITEVKSYIYELQTYDPRLVEEQCKMNSADMGQVALLLERDINMCNDVKYSWFMEYMKQYHQLVKFYQNHVDLLDMKLEYLRTSDLNTKQLNAFDNEMTAEINNYERRIDDAQNVAWNRMYSAADVTTYSCPYCEQRDISACKRAQQVLSNSLVKTMMDCVTMMKRQFYPQSYQ